MEYWACYALVFVGTRALVFSASNPRIVFAGGENSLHGLNNPKPGFWTQRGVFLHVVTTYGQ